MQISLILSPEMIEGAHETVSLCYIILKLDALRSSFGLGIVKVSYLI